MNITKKKEHLKGKQASVAIRCQYTAPNLVSYTGQKLQLQAEKYQ